MDIAIVGAGLAGLAAAIELTESGHTCCVYEASDRPGGRVATDEVDGHLLDRGFQVLLDAYPEVWDLLDPGQLDLAYFLPGARVRADGAFHRISDPFQDPGGLLATLRAPVGTPFDKARILAFRRQVSRGTLDELWARPDTTAASRLADAGFGEVMIERFLRPLFTGITLDPDLAGSSRFLEFVFRMLAAGRTGVPTTGMAALPAALAARLPDETVVLDSPVARVTANPAGAEIELAGGDTEAADVVVVATDAASATELCGTAEVGWRPSTTVWFSAPEPPVTEPILVLNGEGRGPINSLAVMSQVAPAYAPAGSSTVAVSAPVIEPDLAGDFRAQLTEWFGSSVSSWEVLRVDEIARSHPVIGIGAGRPGYVRAGDDHGRVVVCGDHLTDPSINGALASGRSAARAIMAA